MTVQNPQLLWLLLLLPLLLLLQRGRGSSIALLGLRLTTLSCLILALAHPQLGSAPLPEGPLVILVDQSDSLDGATRAALREQSEQLIRSSAEGAHLLYVGADLVSAPQHRGGVTANAVELPDPSGSDLAAGLRMARSLLPGGGRILLISDGLATGGNALLEARRAAEAGITIDVVALAPAARSEVALTMLSVPPTLRVGEEFPIILHTAYRSPPGGDGAALRAQLSLWEGERLLGEQLVELPVGEEQFTFRHTATTVGVMRFRATLTTEGGDSFAANNSAAATALVSPPPRLLLVAQRSEEAMLLADALEQQGMTSRRIAPADLPVRLSELTRFDGIVLIDLPAAALSLDQMATIREFVRSDGRGLLVVGGRNAYSLGAYKDTPLEEVLPVTMEPPPRPQRGEIAMLLMIDRSASMTADRGVSKFDMAREAAILATESLQPEDRIAILAFDTGTLWVVEFQQVGNPANLAAMQQAISSLPTGGGTDIERVLATGLPTLARQTADVRHAILLTDGRSFTNNYFNYMSLMEFARANAITLSTIAIGLDADRLLLEQLADWGGGRSYYADRPVDIPRLTLMESSIARADTLVEGALEPRLNRAHPIMRDFAPAELPPLSGYIATTPRQTAEVVLRAPENDPLLAVWQYGLGRSVAWTATLGAPWAEAWTGWEGFARFWAQVVRYTLPTADSGSIQVGVEPIDGGVRLLVDALQPGGSSLDLATINAQVTLPDGSEQEFAVGQRAPGRYSRDLSLTMPGAYAMTLTIVHDGEAQERAIGYVQPIPAEYRMQEDPLAAQELLTALAVTTGGSLRTTLLPDADPTSGIQEELPRPLWPWLLGTALVLWVSEIALRRRSW